jgi:EAL domain-containing protein (putative c-di-GMP-specific phosphodiesterase class I)
MSVVCEGVETVQQYQGVTALGSDACQGFYFARPMPADRFAGLLDGAAGGILVHLPPISPDPQSTLHSG